MNNANDNHDPNQPLAHAMAQLAARWLCLQHRCAIVLDAAGIAHLWHARSPIEQALMDDAPRALGAATEELVQTLEKFAQGRQALADFGFEPRREDSESP